MSERKYNNESPTTKNIYQQPNSSKINFIDRNESILDSFQEAFNHVRIADQRYQSQEEYYDIPMRRGESVDLEQINENSQAQSYSHSQNVTSNKIQDTTSKKQATVTSSKTSSWSKQSSQVNSHVEDLNQDKMLINVKDTIFQ
ncbi:hypothetical protein TTHERM_00854320 (macronuclear) [Tetrahymena thermophila SB210]|uniref:Uncharacterized protein n=1 Tax=Tetrahymena thermophila (strain SB210) TaxID=312017 RepID=Q23CM7_TETTS|nr:hypothetical protein TTHERM_00854320 [Tetrahymena thermophila SB210]EAR94253.2 hypothetical protein TTHERM_00854320 [Tetrahymena thermophila SB210]|eukprot:XP_001014498.2 hypothetical protein TTHERM_00854320 [Tetrahymena thermophila SB210]